MHIQHVGVLMFYLKPTKNGSDIKLKAENMNEILNTQVVFVKTYIKNVTNEKYFHRPSLMEKASMGTNWINQIINYMKKEFTPSCLRAENKLRNKHNMLILLLDPGCLTVFCQK